MSAYSAGHKFIVVQHFAMRTSNASKIASVSSRQTDVFLASAMYSQCTIWYEYKTTRPEITASKQNQTFNIKIVFLLYHSSRAALGRLTPPRLLELARAAVREARIGMSNRSSRCDSPDYVQNQTFNRRGNTPTGTSGVVGLTLNLGRVYIYIYIYIYIH